MKLSKKGIGHISLIKIFKMVAGSLCFALYVYKVASLCGVISKLADIHSSRCKGKYTRSIGVIELGPKYPKIYGLSK